MSNSSLEKLIYSVISRMKKQSIDGTLSNVNLGAVGWESQMCTQDYVWWASNLT